MQKVFWASKIQVFNISGEKFRKTKNQRRTQIKKNGDIFEAFSNISGNFFPLFFFQLYDDMTRFSTENAVSIA